MTMILDENEKKELQGKKLSSTRFSTLTKHERSELVKQDKKVFKAMKEVARERLDKIQDKLLDKADSLAENSDKLKDIIDYLTFLRDTSGQKPVEQVESKSIGINISVKDEATKSVLNSILSKET